MNDKSLINEKWFLVFSSYLQTEDFKSHFSAFRSKNIALLKSMLEKNINNVNLSVKELQLYYVKTDDFVTHFNNYIDKNFKQLNDRFLLGNLMPAKINKEKGGD